MKFDLFRDSTALGLIFISQIAFADDAADYDVIELDPIFLTSTKRPQDALTFPGAVAQADEGDLENRTVRDVSDLQKVFGDVYIDKRSARVFTNISVRGQPSLDFYNPSVQLYVDGVPQDAGMLDQYLPIGVQNVELLYGPQGTLYGRGAVGGVLNIETYRPGQGSRYAFDTDLGSGQRSARGQAEVQLADGLWADLALSYRDELNDLTLPDGSEVGGSTSESARFRLRYAPIDSPWDVMFTAQYSDIDSDEEYFVPASSWDDRVALPYPSHYTQHTDTFALNVSYDLGWGDFTSVTSYQDRDFDRTIYGYYTPETQKTTTQEFRVSSDQNERLGYVVGLMLQKSDFTRDAYGATVDIGTKSAALFGDLTWAVTDRFSISPGIRFEYESSDANSSGYGTSYAEQDSWDHVSPKLGASYELQEGLSLYGLLSTGYKAGGYSRSALPSAAVLGYDPQRIQNAETGLKFQSLDGRFAGSVSAYYTKTNDYQMFVGTYPLQYLQNVGDVTAKGLDAQFRYSKNGWRVTASAGVVSSEFSNYNNPLDPTTDLSGNRVPFVPETTFNLTIDRRFELANGRGALTPRIGVTYQSQVWFDEANLISQDPLTLLDAGLAWEMKNGTVLDFYVSNLTDETYAEYGFNSGVENAYTLGSGREFGVVLRKTF